MNLRIPFARIDCGGNERRYLDEVLATGWLTSAGKVRTLEERLVERLGAGHALAVSSCTAGLHLALEALSVGPGDKVLVPTFTFTASAEVVRYLGADPVFLDVDPETANLSEAIVADAIERHPDAKALVAVHYGGQAVPMLPGLPELQAADVGVGPGILALCRAAGIRTVEDAAHALPSAQAGRPVGTLGDITCFSFYANKTMTTGEGGLVTTDDDALAARMKSMRLHGISRDVWERRERKVSSWEYDIVAPGFKYNMPDLNAAVGLAQLERLDAMRARRERIAARYIEAFAALPGVAMLRRDVPAAAHSWHLFPILVDDPAIDRGDFIDALAARGIGTSVHYKPLHRMTYYRERYGLIARDFPGAERLWHSIVSLPIYNLLSDEEVEDVIEAVCQVMREGAFSAPRAEAAAT